MFDNIRVVLVATTHAGNIGAAARAMKGMGHRRLYLVNPKTFPCAEATARAAGADDVLAGAQVFGSLAEALAGCGLVIGTSARRRSLPWPMLDPVACARRVIQEAEIGEVALVFGRERTGLTNEELDLCNSVVRIPADPAFNSLNVAAAVQIITYEVMRTAYGNDPMETGPRENTPLATAEQMAQFYEHLERLMIKIEFFDPDKPRRLMRRLKRLFNRVQPDQNEINILRGILASAEKAVRKRRN
ncbi:MAG: tRNA (cytosine(32)/uridine(32)-2'-O)-methyltransferase TrmJ [Gammaproteobacteria bacterium]|nr:tRNA (cytosine(32)/uridine(32)-2'-O)-methyltransferase TrmJ [Gammaproteobacteria bacterium]MCI0591496.1 tRNA (cytosine(32)/uridine(32)-2'-O)-methyltransferase TrmJ [Gammaproteobacteria bacterium]